MSCDFLDDTPSNDEPLGGSVSRVYDAFDGELMDWAAVTNEEPPKDGELLYVQGSCGIVQMRVSKMTPCDGALESDNLLGRLRLFKDEWRCTRISNRHSKQVYNFPPSWARLTKTQDSE